ncbi:hypothetical protein ASPZODRAFT_1421438 [Penicilliopsis zonata CBS 506.65]|uniref:Laminarinase eglC n=1 Tax=Penicilliopsis zonata CBS 506.65 TaxID=1073090 RepID=A0A1L9SPR5_9EURO|nr:hypothetical protein ASPZODRAFT_1421438 [Penicilliopsis zonata CBS 506.65]OJJ49200.1 hypothetical protein ASPZODRAFT_1421438 [Penicilliopsis zonata CBS 506.65]
MKGLLLIIALTRYVFAQQAPIVQVDVWVDDAGNTVSVETRLGPTGIPLASDIPPIPVETGLPAPGLSIPSISNVNPDVNVDVDVNSHSNRQFGISYSPYNADSTCKTLDGVERDIAQLAGKGYALVRIYGVDCDQVHTVTTAAQRHKMRVFAGVYDLENFPNSLQPFIEAASVSSWGVFDTIAIGNELMNRGQNSAAEIVAALNTARARLRDAGFTGPVVTVDTVNSLVTHPELCQASDYCAANCHAFFDGNEVPPDAGRYVRAQMDHLAGSAGKQVRITESGWPHAGQANGVAVPSVQNQRVAIDSLRQAFPDGDLVLFSAFDDGWKSDTQWTFGAEKFWGIQ